MSRNRNSKGRDENGRWVKGHCPNRRGRPRKQLPVAEDDLGIFKQTVVGVTMNGEDLQLTRHALLLHSAYEQAIKGKSVNLRRMLLERFDDVDMTMADARGILQKT